MIAVQIDYDVVFWQCVMAFFAIVIVLCCIALAYALSYDPKGAVDDAETDADRRRALAASARVGITDGSASDLSALFVVPRPITRLANSRLHSKD